MSKISESVLHSQRSCRTGFRLKSTCCGLHQVAGTVGGATYGVALRAVRVLDCNGSGSTSGIIAALNWLSANYVAPAVANMNLAAPRARRRPHLSCTGGRESALDVLAGAALLPHFPAQQEASWHNPSVHSGSSRSEKRPPTSS